MTLLKGLRPHTGLAMLATDQQGSILHSASHTYLYTPYGYDSREGTGHTLLGFNGQPREGALAWYLLGNGYRGFKALLMRFTSPDSYSPFGPAGINCYAYCEGDPLNRSDATGHMPKRRYSAQQGGTSPRPMKKLRQDKVVGVATTPEDSSVMPGKKYTVPPSIDKDLKAMIAEAFQDVDAKLSANSTPARTIQYLSRAQYRSFYSYAIDHYSKSVFSGRVEVGRFYDTMALIESYRDYDAVNEIFSGMANEEFNLAGDSVRYVWIEWRNKQLRASN